MSDAKTNALKKTKEYTVIQCKACGSHVVKGGGRMRNHIKRKHPESFK